MIGNPQLFRFLNRDNYNAWDDGHARHEGSCEKVAGAAPHKHDCCGDWPMRKSYDHDEAECCADGSIEPIGFC